MDLARCLLTHGLMLCLASQEETGKTLGNTFSQLAASPKIPHTCNPIIRGMMIHRAGDRNHPLAGHSQDLAHGDATMFFFFFSLAL